MVADLPVRLLVNDPALASEVSQLFGPMAEHPGPYEAEIVFDAHAPAMPRVMLSYATEHLDPAERARYRAMR